MKGAIQADHMPVNKYELLMLGMPPLTPTEISGIEDELQTTELPDRTRASGGNRGPTEFTMMLPMHHLVEQAAMEVWFRSSQDPVLPTYKIVGTLIHKSISGETLRTYSLVGAFPSKRVLPDLEMANEGEMAAVEWTISVDDILPI
jgi:hypothetical protein